MRVLLVSIGLLLLSISGSAQTILQDYDKPYNIGVRVGFNSAFPLVNSFTINDEAITDYHIHYKVGYLAAVTFSVNFNRYFIQPSISWYRSNAEIQFDYPLFNSGNTNIAGTQNAVLKLDSEVNSLEVPILIGYHIIKEGPYGMSIKFGPKGIYHYKSDYTLNSSVVSFRHEKDNIPYAVNFVSAIGVTIGRLFLDFSYEFGIHSVRSDFTYTDVLTGEEGTASLSQRTNKLSFSLGFIF